MLRDTSFVLGVLRQLEIILKLSYLTEVIHLYQVARNEVIVSSSFGLISFYLIEVLSS